MSQRMSDDVLRELIEWLKGEVPGKSQWDNLEKIINEINRAREAELDAAVRLHKCLRENAKLKAEIEQLYQDKAGADI